MLLYLSISGSWKVRILPVHIRKTTVVFFHIADLSYRPVIRRSTCVNFRNIKLQVFNFYNKYCMFYVHFAILVRVKTAGPHNFILAFHVSSIITVMLRRMQIPGLTLRVVQVVHACRFWRMSVDHYLTVHYSRATLRYTISIIDVLYRYPLVGNIIKNMVADLPVYVRDGRRSPMWGTTNSIDLVNDLNGQTTRVVMILHATL